MEIGKKIAQLRKEKGISQKRLAELSGLGISTIQKIEYGSFRPKSITLRKIANALGVSISEIDDDETNHALEQLMKEFLQSPYKKMLDAHSEILRKNVELLNKSAPDNLTVQKFLSLDSDGKAKVAEYIDLLLPKYKKEDTHSNE